MENEIDISVVLPVYKNEFEIVELYKQIKNHLRGFSFEIIFVNDNSPDNSENIINDLANLDNRINLISLKVNVGQHIATLTGLTAAQGNKIVVMDADLQDDPALIIQLVPLLVKNGDVAFVKRKGNYQSLSKMFTSTLIKKVMQVLSGLHYKAGSYYIFEKSILLKIIAIGKSCKYPYMSIIVAHSGKQLHYFSSTRGKSISGSGYNFFSRFSAALKAIYCSIYCSYWKIKNRVI